MRQAKASICLGKVVKEGREEAASATAGVRGGQISAFSASGAAKGGDHFLARVF